MTKIDEIWNSLENDNSFSNGLLLRRYSAEILPDIFIAYKVPEKFRCIAASLSNPSETNLTLFTRLRDISVEVLKDERSDCKSFLVFKLLNNEHCDIFSILCEDLILSVASIKNEEKLYQELLSRFEKWKSLFDRISSQGLSSEEQRGLYGELFFLRKFLQNNTDHQKVISSWVGVEKQVRDFELGKWAVEVKTSFGNNHQKVHISSERQLDTTNISNLFLYHLSLDSKLKNGETLNDLVKSIELFLSKDFLSLSRFKNKLLEAGYFDNHKTYYSGIGYFIRNEDFYKVENDFPRIEESDIRNGVGDVKYSIIISQCPTFRKDEEHVFNKLVFNE